MEEYPRRRLKSRPQKKSREVRDRDKPKVVKNNAPIPDSSDDLFDIQRQIARQNGFLICDECRAYSPIGTPQCLVCDANLRQ